VPPPVPSTARGCFPNQDLQTSLRERSPGEDQLWMETIGTGTNASSSISLQVIVKSPTSPCPPGKPPKSSFTEESWQWCVASSLQSFESQWEEKRVPTALAGAFQNSLLLVCWQLRSLLLLCLCAACGEPRKLLPSPALDRPSCCRALAAERAPSGPAALHCWHCPAHPLR